MRKALILKNIFHENPGLVEKCLDQRGWSYDVVDLNEGQSIPTDTSDYHILVVLGGPASANDNSPIILGELRFIKQWSETGRPYLGICLGLQLLVKALGGSVVKCQEKEIGFLDPRNEPYHIELTQHGFQDPLFLDMKKKLPVFQLHGERVQLTEGMTLLATSKLCSEQIVKGYEKGYGIQCHFELTEAMLRQWTVEDVDLIPIGEEILLKQYQAIKVEYERTGMKLIQNFLKLSEQ